MERREEGRRERGSEGGKKGRKELDMKTNKRIQSYQCSDVWEVSW